MDAQLMQSTDCIQKMHCPLRPHTTQIPPFFHPHLQHPMDAYTGIHRMLTCIHWMRMHPILSRMHPMDACVPPQDPGGSDASAEHPKDAMPPVHKTAGLASFGCYFWPGTRSHPKGCKFRPLMHCPKSGCRVRRLSYEFACAQL